MYYMPYDETPTEGTAMLNNMKFKKTEPTDLEKQIARLFAHLDELPMDSDEYNAVSDQVKKLYPLKETDSKSRVSRDTLVAAASNIAGILLVLQYENLNIITSKAFGMVRNVK